MLNQWIVTNWKPSCKQNSDQESVVYQHRKFSFPVITIPYQKVTTTLTSNNVVLPALVPYKNEIMQYVLVCTCFFCSTLCCEIHKDCCCRLLPWSVTYTDQGNNLVLYSYSLLWLILSWYTLFHSFTFNLSRSLHFKWISCRQHLVVFTF